MREPMLDRFENWEDFIAKRRRMVDEINVALPQMEPWERDMAEFELDRIWFELRVAEGYVEADSGEE